MKKTAWWRLGVLLAGFLALPAVTEAQSYVVSVEYVEISLGAGATQNSTSLTKGQTIANCVPFASLMTTGVEDDFDQLFTDVYFEAGPQVTARREVAGGTIDVGVYVVEFDPAYVTVQQNVTELSFVGTSTTTGITAVDTTKAALVFYYRGSFSTHEWQDHAVAGWFSAANTLSFQRDRDLNNDTVYVHWYVFEANNSEFSVQPVSLSIAGGADFGTASISSVDLTKSFVIGSYRSAYDDDNVRSSAAVVYLSSDTEVRAERNWDSGLGITDIRAFVVELSGNASVERGSLAYSDTGTQQTATIANVSTDDSIVWNGMSTGPGVMWTAEGTSTEVETAFQRIKLTDATTVQGDRGEGSVDGTYPGDALGRFEVIDFSGVSGGPASLYRSVGTNGLDLNTSSRTVQISGNTAVFSGPMPDNVGVGDALTYVSGGNQLAFIHGRSSSTVFTVADKDGGVPTSTGAGTAVGVYRAYTSLNNWETQTQNPAITEPSPGDVNPSLDLVAANTVMMVACYGDGQDSTAVTINGWTTGPTNYIKIYTPTNTLEVGTTQRHDGKWDTTSAYRLVTGDATAIYVQDNYVKIDGLQVYLQSVDADDQQAIYFRNQSGAGEGTVSNCILRGITTGFQWHTGVVFFEVGTLTLNVYNNIIYGFVGSSASGGVVTDDVSSTAYVYNNTMFDCKDGIFNQDGTVVAKNNLVFNSNDDYTGLSAGSDSNLGEEASGGGTNYIQTSQTAAQMFVDPAGSPPDFHILATSDAADQGANLSGDSNLAFTDDIDDDPRGAVWDIGADEIAATPLYRSVGINAADLNTNSRTAEITGTTATFSGPMPANVGVGDVLQYNDGSYRLAFIHGRSSDTVYTVRSASGGTPQAAAAGMVVGVYRSYTSLFNWEGQDENDTLDDSVEDFDTSTDLVTPNITMNAACYGDGEDATGVTILGWTTGPDNYIKIYTPVSSNEVGTSQRHDGKWNTSAYRISNDPSTNDTIDIEERYVRIAGLQVDSANYTGTGFLHGIYAHDGNGDAPAEFHVSHSIIRMSYAGVPDIGGVGFRLDAFIGSNSDYVAKLWNNIVYGYTAANASGGSILTENNGTAYVYNNTCVDGKRGISAVGSTIVHAKNNISIDAVDPYFTTTAFHANSTNNVSDTGVAPGSNPVNGEPTFVNKAGEDYHLAVADAVAQNAGFDLSSDPELAVTDDIDGGTRGTPWDIGADDRLGGTSNLTQGHYRWRNDDANEASATWADAQDAKLTGLPKNAIRRIRFQVSNEGGSSSGPVTYQLQVAETATCSTGSYAAVPTDSSGHWQVIDSSFITDGEATTNVTPGLVDEATTFVSGEAKDTGNTTGSITLNADEFSEIEFAVQATTNATYTGDYCFRLYDSTNTTPLSTYSVHAEVSVADPPSLTLVDHDAGQVADQFGASTPVTSEFFAFKLTRSDPLTVDNVRVHFSTGGGVVDGDVTNGELWRDVNNNGVVDGPDTSVQTGVNASGGILSFTSLGEDPGGAGTNYLVQADIANLVPGDVTTFSLQLVDIDELEAGVDEDGSVSFAIHTFDSASGGDVYYSVGTSRPTDLKTGAPNISITNGTATLDQAQTGHIGLGDEINYVGGIAYISFVLSQTQFIVHTANGGVPPDVGSATVNSIMRAFPSLASAEASSGGGSHLNNFNLTAVGADANLHWVCYNDGDLAAVNISSYTTDPTHTITLTVAGALQVASGVGQHHDGTPGSGVRIDNSGGSGDAVVVSDHYVTVELLEIDNGFLAAADGIQVSAPGVNQLAILRNNLIHDIDREGIVTGSFDVNVYIINNIIYDGNARGIRINGPLNGGNQVRILNNTIYNMPFGGLAMNSGAAMPLLQNNIIHSSTPAPDFSASNLDPNSSNNLASDPTGTTHSPNLGGQDNVSLANVNFVDEPGRDLHIQGGSFAQNAGANLSGLFTRDIDGETRGAVWDIGADETLVATNYRSIGTNTGNLHASGTASVPIGSTTVTFSVALPLPTAVGAIGEGDNLTIEGETLFILSRDSDFQVTLQSPATVDHTTPTVTFTITRAYNTLQAWEDACAASPCLALSGGGRGGDLVADNRLEVGVAYKDGPFVPPYATANSALAINGSTTSADHFIWLTVAPGQRHDGTAGTGVVVDGQGATKFGIQDLDNFSRVEWLELVGFFTDVLDSEFAGIVTVGTNALYQNLLIHGFRDLDAADSGYGIRVSTTPGPWSFTVRNSIFYDGDHSAIRIDESSSSIIVENCTIFGMEQFGVSLGSSAGTATVTNTIAMNQASNSFNVSGGLLTQSNNISSDGTAAGPGSLINRDSTDLASPGAPPQGNGWVMFQNLTGGSEDFHLRDDLAQNDALQAGQDLSSSFTRDIDDGDRVAPWDIGADEAEATTAVELVSFEAFGVDGAVELRWETGSELDNLGFHLYRSRTEKGLYEQITASVIPGLGSSPEGAKYAYRDSGLTNGVTYFYKLEDIETTGVTELHGPVSAMPTTEVVVEDDVEGEEDSKGEELGELSSRITYGDPSANELKVRRRGKKWMELTLITEGFYAIPQEDGSVLLEVPGFEDFGGSDLPDVPAYRTWQDVLAGRNVKLASVKVGGVAEFASLRPSSSALIVVASGDGTVQTGRRRKRRRQPLHVYYPESWAQLMNVGFQGSSKKALVEMAPLRWDATAEKLVLAKRLVVSISFKGKDKAELKLGKSHREVDSHFDRNVLARIAVSEPGLYGVSFESVFGKKGKARKTKDLSLSRHGEPVAFFVTPNRKKFKKKSTLYFVSEGSELNPYGSEAVYELLASRAGTPMGLVDGRPVGAPTSFYWKTIEREENLLYQAAFENEESIWQWDWLFGPMTNSYPFEVQNLSSAPENSKLRVWLHGASDFPEDPDHHVRLYVNGTLITETWWDGETPHFVEAELGPGLLQEGENTLEIEEVGDTEAQYSMVMLDRFEVSYPSQLVGELKGSFSESGVANLDGPPGFVFDVTENEPKKLTGTNGTSFRVESGHRYLLASEVLTPEVRRSPSTGLKKAWSRAEYLVIGPRAFLAAAESLLAHRRNEGLITGAIATEDIFDEFGYGEATPESIRDFLSYVYHHWSEPTLRYVVLLGDGTYDFKDYLATGVKGQVPVKIVKTQFVWTASDPWYGAINGDDILPDVAIGRLPAASIEEVERLVQKILDYESQEGEPEAPVILIADNPDGGGNFDADAEGLASTVLTEERLEKIYLSQLGAAGAHGAIMNAFDDGASLVSYMGHGAIHLWANENLLNIWDVESLSPQSQQPLLLTMNCLNGYFHFPYFNSLSEELLKAEGKGVIAAFSPTGLSLNSPAHRFHKAVLEQVVNQSHGRLGDAILAAQGIYAHTGSLPELITVYHLLGDPALKLR